MATTTAPCRGCERAPVGLSWAAWVGWYRLALLLALFLVFSAQKFVQVRQVLRIPRVPLFEVANRGPAKQWIGIVISFAFLALLAEFATAGVARRVARRLPPRIGRASPLHPDPTTRLRGAFLLAAGLFFLAGLQGSLLSGYVAATPSPGPAVALAWVAAWAGFALVAPRRPPRWGVDLCGFVGLVLVSRIYAYSYLPMASISGDMLPTIDRTMGLFMRGEFPYVDDPPPAMPYWPITFLQYAPPWLAGWDLRVSNLVVEVATVVVAFLFLDGARPDRPDAVVARMALPTAMLFPSWTFYGAETQYPASVLLATIFCRAVGCSGGRSQALALGFAVAGNQTFGALGLFLFPFWVRWFGLPRALRLAAMALGICLLVISPFLLWDAPEFVRVSLLSLRPFTADQIAGTFSLRPLLVGMTPLATPILLALTLAAVAAVASVGRASRAEAASILALAYCVVLLLLHRSFTHYFLPVMAMILAIPHPIPALEHRPEGRRLGPAAGREMHRG